MTRTERIYLDHNATTPLRVEASEALVRAVSSVGNPSSVHAEGRAARELVEQAREAVAALVGSSARRVAFTSGGTEANNLVLAPGLRRAGDARGATYLLMGAGEHASVLDGHRFPAEQVETLPLDASGVVDLAHLERRLDELADERVLVSLQMANNETGVIQPVAEAAALVRRHGGLLHTDAVQAAGRVALDVVALGVDALTLSAHKIGGPQGAGALVLGSDLDLVRLVRGGGQERGRRAGTENVAAIAGFGAAARVAARDLDAEAVRLTALRDAAEAALRRAAPSAWVAGATVPRLPNTFLFAVPGRTAETLLIAFDLAGAAVSSGSACSSGKVARSHVLAAMGIDPDLAAGAIRVSFGWTSTDREVARFAAICEKLFASLYGQSRNDRDVPAPGRTSEQVHAA